METLLRSREGKGGNSIKLPWTKGHASWQHVLASGNNAMAIGNGQADLAADLGTEASGKSSQQKVLAFHAEKQRSYEQLIGRLQMFAAKLLAHDKELRKEAGFLPQGKKALPVVIEAPPMATRHDFSDGEGLNLLPLPPCP